MTWKVYLTRGAVDDLQRVEDFLIEQALRHGDLDLPMRALDSIQRELKVRTHVLAAMKNAPGIAPRGVTPGVAARS